ncbi:MAG TPA: sulfatase [bacterium]|nr:sulfatase [bacterium]
MERRLLRWNSLLAFLAIPLLAGGIAGLVDALASLGAAGVERNGPALFLLAPSLGALLATLPLLIVAPVAFAFGSRRPGSLLALSATTLLLLLPAFLFFRFLYKRLPWNAVDVCLAIGGAFALLFCTVALARWASQVLGARGAKAAAFLARCTPFLLLLLIPALVRGVPAMWKELAAESRSTFTSAVAASANAPAPGLNVLLLTIDTIRPDSFGACGNPTVRTPHLDRFSRRALQFPVCVTPAPWTLPSLASLLTGRYPGEHKVLEALGAPPDSIRSLPEIFLKEGRSTAAFVSNPWLATGTLARGFQTFEVAERLECYREMSATRLYRALSKSLLRARQLDQGERITDRGLSWIESAAGRNRPWFVWLHYFDPHLPNWPPPPLDRLTGPPPHQVNAAITVEQIRAGDFSGGEQGRDEIERLYWGEVTVTDHAIGRVLRQLERWGIFEHTVVVVTGDHGEEFWEHGDYGHGHAMYDEIVRVPLLWSAPQIERGAIDARMARLIDVAPTLLALLGVTPSNHFAGNALLANSESGEREAYGEGTLYGPEKKFLRSETTKIVFTPPADSAAAVSLQVFDLVHDPAERRDLSRENPALADSLMMRLTQWIQRAGTSRKTSSGSIPGGVDPSIEEQLRALGYIR